MSVHTVGHMQQQQHDQLCTQQDAYSELHQKEEQTSSASSAYSTQSSNNDSAPATQSPNPLDLAQYELSYQMSLLHLQQQLPVSLLSTVVRTGGPGSDSGTSSVDHTASEQDARIAAANENLPQGPWYFEVAGAGDDGPLSALRGTRNSTAQVPVPSSEHVAEIVGRQGCKIKALRAKTNTYIKTPVRGEQPCFVITGRQEDVDVAKAEIEQAADHFTQIRASRRHSQGGQPIPGHITAYVRVPYRVVGLVVGPKGGTIKRIQQDTHTYIITPSREREPIFEVTGLPDNVEKARVLIEDHILQRTGVRPSTDCANGDTQVAMAPVQQQPMSVQNMSDYAAYLNNNNVCAPANADLSYNTHDLYQQQQYPGKMMSAQQQYPQQQAQMTGLKQMAQGQQAHGHGQGVMADCTNQYATWETYAQQQQATYHSQAQTQAQQLPAHTQQQQYQPWSNQNIPMDMPHAQGQEPNLVGQALGHGMGMFTQQHSFGLPAYSMGGNSQLGGLNAMAPALDCTRDEGIGGSPLESYQTPSTWSMAGQSSVEWTLPNTTQHEHCTTSAASSSLAARTSAFAVPESPSNDSVIHPPAHLIMASIWSDLDN